MAAALFRSRLARGPRGLISRLLTSDADASSGALSAAPLRTVAPAGLPPLLPPPPPLPCIPVELALVSIAFLPLSPRLLLRCPEPLAEGVGGSAASCHP